MYEKLKEIRRIALDAINNIKAAANDAINGLREQTAKVSPQKRDRILKAALWGGFAAIVVGGMYYWRTRNQQSNVTEIQ